MDFSGASITSFLIAVSFSAGLNVYATIATLGLLSRFDFVTLPPGLHLQATWVIVVAVLLFGVEFVADKVPVLDVVWSAAHTFIRIPLAALLAFNSAQQFPMQTRLLITLAGAAVAGVAHGSKTAARTAVTASPEPVSNAAFSTVEDAGAVALTWLATKHPYAAGMIATIALVGCLLLIRYIVRWLRATIKRLEQRIKPSLKN